MRCKTIKRFHEDDVDMDKFLYPTSHYNLDEAVKEITEGSGYYVLKGLFSEQDVSMAVDKVSLKRNTCSN